MSRFLAWSVGRGKHKYQYRIAHPVDDDVHQIYIDLLNSKREEKKKKRGKLPPKKVDDDANVGSSEKYYELTYESGELQPPKRRYNEYEQDSHKLDIIIFGATGSLGSYTVLNAINVLSQYRWGIAGRNQYNLQKVLRIVGAMSNQSLSGIPIFIVDATDNASLLAMAQECLVLINCCGPYEETASAVIQACITAGTNYVDACIQPTFLSEVRARFNTAAANRHVFIITSCGFMSFVIDVGVNYIEAHFKGTVHSVEAFTQFSKLNSETRVPIMSCAAFRSMIFSFANAKQLLGGTPDCNCIALVPKLNYKSPMSVSDAVTGVSIPLPFIDQQAVETSQEYLHEYEEKRPIQFKNYLTFPSYFTAFLALLWCILLFVLSQAPGTRDLLLRYPKVFSLGMCTTECLERENLDKFLFTLTLKATGWDPKSGVDSRCSDNTPNPHCGKGEQQNALDQPVNKTMKVKISGPNPFYGYGCIALLCSATTILKETKNMPERGGVYTPGAAFFATRIGQECAKYNSRFKYKISE